MQKLLLVFFSVFLSLKPILTMGQAQNPGNDPYTYAYETPNLASQTKNDILIVTAAGIAGAVLGLSTLSFVSEPEDHYDNILTGGAIGIIAGVIYVAYRQASAPSPFEDPDHKVRSLEDRTYTFHYQDLQQAQKRKASVLKPVTFGFTTNF